MPKGGIGYCGLVDRTVVISEDGCNEEPCLYKNKPGCHVYKPCPQEKH